MLAAVLATDKRLIAPQYLMQIFAHLAFSYTRLVAYCWLRKTLVAIHCMHSRENLICIQPFAHKMTMMAHCSLQDNFSVNVAVFNVYK